MLVINTVLVVNFSKVMPQGMEKNKNSTSASNKVANMKNLTGRITFSHGSYTQYSKLKGFVIYCDPPYISTEKHYTDSFDSKEFYKWCRDMSKHNIVFISEYNAPPDFELIWSHTSKLTGVSKSQGKHTSKSRTEKLYVL